MNISMSNGFLGISLGIDEFCRTLVHEAPDAIVYADADGMIRFWNRAAERLFEFSRSEVLGKSLDMIIPQNLRERYWEAYGNAMQSRKTRYGAGDKLAVPALRKDGAQVPVEFTILLFSDREGRSLGAAAILRDATKRHEETDNWLSGKSQRITHPLSLAPPQKQEAKIHRTLVHR